ncbi:HAMP domain-containing sensor histidine kinase [Vallitalea sp. AN17-2]|uniref:HAMP domain-containing sensor histidine kinase n=1 Tax=Vallitalea maricola TaxID=3074433 RepID=A0ACB5ULE4_9FIRM|nr:HAMP domain-containing sensor histidine kinase [Vallitalea sp. AN17-2]
MISLSKRIMKNSIIISLVTVIVIIILSNIGIKYYFTDYLIEQNKVDNEEIITYVNTSIENDGIIDNRELSYLKQQAHFKNVEIVLQDIDKEIIFVSSMGMGKGMGMGNSMHKEPFKEDYTYLEKKLTYEGQTIGYLSIGHYKNIITAKEDNDFIYTINILYVISFFIAVLLAIFLSLLLVRRLTRPIIEIKDSTHNISKGNYERVKSINTDTKELNELATSIEELARQLSEQEQLRKRLSNDISHELRSPLAVLRSQIEALMDGVLEPSPERLAKLNDEIVRMTKLINDLNELVIVESEHLRLNTSKVNVENELSTIIEGFIPLMDSKDIKLIGQLEKDIFINGDRDRLKQIFVNLLTNAYKYTNRGGSVKVTLTKNTDEAIIRFIDSGIGIKKEDLTYVFQRFYRGDESRSRKTGGAGIGLSIVKELVKAHEGIITVDSELGKGSIFTIKFKLAT